MAKDSRARQPAAQGANEVQRVDLDAIAAHAPGKFPASWAIEHNPDIDARRAAYDTEHPAPPDRAAPGAAG